MTEDKPTADNGPSAQEGANTARDARVYLWWAGIAFIIFVLIYQAWQIRSLQGQMKTQRDEHAQEMSRLQDEAAKERLMAAADAFASGIEPLMFLRNRGGEVTDETIRQVVANLGQKGAFSLIVVVDAAGMVVATTDMAKVVVGQRYAGYQGPGDRADKNDQQKWVVQRPISRQGNLGSVILIDR